MKNKFKKGAASFYIVAFSTLILMIVAISFAAVIISEVERTSNDDLSQSAYDSALAGIEDAKLAYYNYLNCKLNDAVSDNCSDTVAAMDDGNAKKNSDNPPCDMVWKMLGRDGSGEVVESTKIGNNMSQVTTCVTMRDELEGYRGSLSPSKTMDVIQPKFGVGDDYISADKIDRIVVKWYSDRNIRKSGTNFSNNGKKLPTSAGFPITPPVIAVTVLQTGNSFTMDSFNDIVGGDNGQTNRGMIYLLPKQNSGNNSVSKNEVVASNDKKVQKEPHEVNCNGDTYLCSVEINLPKPIGGVRNSDTFEVIVNMPYGQVETDFLVEFYCSSSSPCITKEVVDEGDSAAQQSGLATLKGVQLEIDSTGRANDLYRRVVATLKSKNDIALSIMGPLELLGGDEGDGLEKKLTVTKEFNFED